MHHSKLASKRRCRCKWHCILTGRTKRSRKRSWHSTGEVAREMFWFIPTTGDGRYLGSSHGSRLTDYAYLRQIAQAVDELGYGAVLLPTGTPAKMHGWSRPR